MAQERQAQRLQELKDQQNRWMRERQAEIDRQRVVEEMHSASSGEGMSMNQGQGSFSSSQGRQQGQGSFSGPQPSAPTQQRTRSKGLMDAAAQELALNRSWSPASGGQQPSGPGPPQLSGGYSGSNRAPGMLDAFRPEEVIDKLTERITDRLRSELKVELQRESEGLAAQATAQALTQDNFLAKELENQNTCPICYELMVPPERAPHLLFPCGHTFCATCATTHIEQHRRNHCPVCRKKIESRALNYPLQQLILNWVGRRDSGRLGAGGGGASVQGSAAFNPGGMAGGGGGGGDEGGADEIRRRCERVELRLRVLRNELLDVMAEEEAIAKRQAAAASVVAHLADAESEALAQLAAAQAQVDLVRRQQEQQAHKAAEVADQAARLSASRAMLVATISPLEEEQSKLQMLSAGIREQQHG